LQPRLQSVLPSSLADKCPAAFRTSSEALAFRKAHPRSSPRSDQRLRSAMRLAIASANGPMAACRLARAFGAVPFIALRDKTASATNLTARTRAHRR